MAIYFAVLYKGYLYPVVGTECPPLTTKSTTTTEAAAAAQQSWADAPARIAKPKPAKPMHNTDVEVFDSGRTTTPSTKPESEKPSINIEIHNVFSFGTSNNTRTEEDSKISVSQKDQTPIIYA